MNVMSIWRSGAPAHPYRKSQPVGVAHIPPFSRRSPTSRRRRCDDRWDAGTDERSHCWNHVAQRGSTMEPDRVVYVSVASKSLRRSHATLIGRKLELMITRETSRLRSRRLFSRICRPQFSLKLSVRCSQTSEHCPRLITAKLAHIAGIALEHRFEMLDRLWRILALMKPDLCKRKVGFIVASLH